MPWSYNRLFRGVGLHSGQADLAALDDFLDSASGQMTTTDQDSFLSSADEGNQNNGTKATADVDPF